MLGHRDKGLAALGVALDQIKGVGQGARLGLKDRNAGLGPARIHLRQIVVALAKAIVDQPELSRCLQHIAEGGKGLGCQGLGCDSVHLGRVAKAGGGGKGDWAADHRLLLRQSQFLQQTNSLIQLCILRRIALFLFRFKTFLRYFKTIDQTGRG